MREEITPSQKPFRSLVDVELLGQAPSLGATHVLVGIDWGAMGTITCEDENSDGEETTKVKGALEAELNKLKGLLDAKGSASADFADKHKSTGRKFTYYSKCDMVTFPSHSRELWSRPRSFPPLCRATTTGKESPSRSA